LAPKLFLTCHVYRPLSQAIFPWPAIFFTSAALNGLYEHCEFENELLPPFVGVLYVDLEDGGHLAGVLFEYEEELVEPPLLLAKPAERTEQEPPLFRDISVSVLRRRTDQRPLVYLI
jgi:hypothetical protein